APHLVLVGLRIEGRILSRRYFSIPLFLGLQLDLLAIPFVGDRRQDVGLGRGEQRAEHLLIRRQHPLDQPIRVVHVIPRGVLVVVHDLMPEPVLEGHPLLGDVGRRLVSEIIPEEAEHPRLG
ncbi:MAG: hypothetical protein ACK55Z_04880, partial [bacterium]